MQQRVFSGILFPRQLLLAVYTLLLLVPLTSRADSIAMSDYIHLSRGMTEAEVLYRVGPPDHETIASDYYQNIIKKTWYYIPAQNEVSNRQWITEIVFSGNGKVRSLNRFKP